MICLKDYKIKVQNEKYIKIVVVSSETPLALSIYLADEAARIFFLVYSLIL